MQYFCKYHNHDMSGIADINGNLWEWTGGLRLMDGEIQIIPVALFPSRKGGNNPCRSLCFRVVQYPFSVITG